MLCSWFRSRQVARLLLYYAYLLICFNPLLRSSSCPEHHKCCRQFSHELQRFKTANHSIHITGYGTVDHAAMFAALLNYYPVFSSSLSLPKLPSDGVASVMWTEKYVKFLHYASNPPAPHPPHSFLDPLLASRKNIFFLHVGEKEEKAS